MKSKLVALLLALTTHFAWAHGGGELGPNGGRILELSRNETLHGEVTVKDGKFQMALLDKNMKPLAPAEHSVSVTIGDRAKPQKLDVQKVGDRFVFPLVKEGQWVIVQIRENAQAKPVPARFEYDPSPCEKCKAPEWLCKCPSEKVKK